MKTVVLSFAVTIFLIICGVIPALIFDGKNFINMCMGFFRLDLTGKIAFTSGMSLGFGVLFFFVYTMESTKSFFKKKKC